jgi:hypothetical protein
VQPGVSRGGVRHVQEGSTLIRALVRRENARLAPSSRRGTIVNGGPRQDDRRTRVRPHARTNAATTGSDQ